MRRLAAKRQTAPTPPVYIRFDRFEDDVPRWRIWGCFVQLHLLNAPRHELDVLIGVL